MVNQIKTIALTLEHDGDNDDHDKDMRMMMADDIKDECLVLDHLSTSKGFVVENNNDDHPFNVVDETREDDVFSPMEQHRDMYEVLERGANNIEQRESFTETELVKNNSYNGSKRRATTLRNYNSKFEFDATVFRDRCRELSMETVLFPRESMVHLASGDKRTANQEPFSRKTTTDVVLCEQVRTFSHDGVQELYGMELDFPFTVGMDEAELDFPGSVDIDQAPDQQLDSALCEASRRAVFLTDEVEDDERNPSSMTWTSTTDEVEQEEEDDRQTTPGKIVTNGRTLIQTPLGPAFLLARAPVTTPITATLNNNKSSNRKFQRWSDDEDELLKVAVDVEGNNWKKIASKYFSNTRSGLQCKSRWTKSLQPGLVRGEWSQEEDALIMQLRFSGLKWSQIAEKLPGRIGEHVRDRFVNALDPNLKKTPWTAEEDRILFEQQRLFGNKWTEISKMIPGRSENAVKNRWHNAKMTQRRRMRRQAAERSRQEQSKRARCHQGSSPINQLKSPAAQYSKGVVGV